MTALKRAYSYIQTFKLFATSEKIGGFVLIICTLISLLLSNSVFGEGYMHFWHEPLDLSFGPFELNFPVEVWINDFLMAIFFLLVGLEIEREIYVGELSDIKKALVPVFAALGGMVMPGLIHFALNYDEPTRAGFAIPMATDIAFALGILALGGKYVPIALKVFLTALAIIDDLGAILVIAFFYTTDLNFQFLLGALSIFGLMLLFNRLKIHYLGFYIIPGLFLWYCMLKSGVHATISGVLIAFAIPFTESKKGKNLSVKVQHALHYPVSLLILPIFALANTAFHLPASLISSLGHNNSLGIILGLVLGKVLGIFGFAWLTVKMRWGSLYSGLTWKKLIGASLLGGIGFTMSIFITTLAFTGNTELITESKLSILFASIIAAILGLTIIVLSGKKRALQMAKEFVKE